MRSTCRARLLKGHSTLVNRLTLPVMLMQNLQKRGLLVWQKSITEHNVPASKATGQHKKHGS